MLDLSLHNPLLSYRKSKRRTLQVVNELPDVMSDRLIESCVIYAARMAAARNDRPIRHLHRVCDQG
ncbi:DUF4011 domain-containing protein [Rhodopirellula europaea]|uniref:DUF4011 domain-containing protein n=1 Tax=Rhodopirellula europaea TaxID=1263866 RepID=UPI0003449FA9